jgi:hypothetical protein
MGTDCLGIVLLPPYEASVSLGIDVEHWIRVEYILPRE